MDLLLFQHSVLICRLRRKNPSVKVEELKQFFDNLIVFIKNLTYTNIKTDGLDILTIICDDLASIHTLQLFDHPVLINHPIFIYIGRTLEMLLTKSNHSKSIPMKKHEESCFDSISYLITQLCSYRNETIESFYGSISNEILPVTDKINIRDETIDENSRKSNAIAEKPNLKVSSLPPNAPKSRPIVQRELDITKIIHRKKFPDQIILSLNETITEFSKHPPLPTDLPSQKYQDIFLTKSFLDKLTRAIDDLSQNEYSPYHIKYKVVDRLVRLCSKLNIVDILLDPIVKCLRSKFYRQTFLTIESEQFRFNPKQLFFIYQCSQFIIQYEFQRQEQIPNLLCQTMIEVTKPIIDHILPNDDDDEMDSKYYNDRGIALQALRCHLELLNYFTLTSSGRRYFLQSNIIDQMINILNHSILIDNGCENEDLFHADVGIIANTLMILYNLAYEKLIFLILKQKNFENIYSQSKLSKDNTIQFAFKILSTILSEDEIDEENEPIKLKKTYIEYMQKIIIESKQTVRLGVTRDRKKRDDTKHMVLTQSFSEKLMSDIEDLAINGYPPNALKYKDVSRRVRVCTKQDTKESEKLLSLLLNPILKCLNSEFYLEVFDNIDLSQTKAVSGVIVANQSLAMKHLFFMRECPEFLFRHDYKQYDDIANSLGKKMLEYTTKIFEKHLPILVGDQDKEGLDTNKPARMEALSYHIKMLTHFTQTRSMRQEFLGTSIIDDILLILEDQSLFDNHNNIADAKLGVVGQSLTLLYNLAFDNQIYSKLEERKVLDICLKLRFSKDKIIHFTSQILSVMLNKGICDDIKKPDLLSKSCIEYIDKSVKEPIQIYQGIKLNGLLKNVKIIIQDDSFIENFVEDKEGIPAITKCVYVKRPDQDPNLKTTKKIQKTAIDIIWRLSSYGPTISKKLKQNDLFIDQLLTLLNETSNKTKQVVDAILWRLGSVEIVRLEQTQNEAKRQKDTTDDDQLPSSDEWDESIPYDLLISYSNNVSDKILSLKIYNRLVKKGYRVYCEKQGKHRLELMQKAIAKKKPILVCLSKSYRSSKVCMAEAEYADKRSCPIIPVIVEAKFIIQGWLKHIVRGKTPIDFTGKKIDEALLNLCVEIEKLKSSD